MINDCVDLRSILVNLDFVPRSVFTVTTDVTNMLTQRYGGCKAMVGLWNKTFHDINMFTRSHLQENDLVSNVRTRVNMHVHYALSCQISAHSGKV